MQLEYYLNLKYFYDDAFSTDEKVFTSLICASKRWFTERRDKINDEL